jgi:cysteine desulfurase
VIEHPAVRELLLQYKEQGICDVTFLQINSDGIVDLKELKKELRVETILVSVMYVNNEIGTIQPIAEVSKIVRHYKKEKNIASTVNIANTNLSSSYPLVHTDACQAVLFCPLRIPSLGVDIMTLDSAKFYGPRSVGALYIKRNIIQSKTILPIQIGGSQEFDMRAGTENVAGISGFAHALDIAVAEREKESRRLADLRDSLVGSLKKFAADTKSDKKILKIIFNGSYGLDSYGNPMRVPNNINICVPGMDAEYAVLRLDVKGVCVSSVTSCRSKKEDSSSYVVEALGGEPTKESVQASTRDCGKSSLRITLGRFTTKNEITYAERQIIKVLEWGN